MSKNEKISYILAVVIVGVYLIYSLFKDFNPVKIFCYLMALIIFYYFVLYWRKYWEKKEDNKKSDDKYRNENGS